MSATNRVLVLGKNGQVGSALVRHLSRNPELEVIAAGSNDLDLRNIDSISSFLASHSPQWLFNGAAYTAVDLAESNEEEAYLVNARAPETMAKYCAAKDCRLVHFSTDYVFDGLSDVPYLESDPVNPLGVYGKSKLAGEESVMAALPDAIIFRTAWVYSRTGKNFVNTMLRLAQAGTELNVVDDQWGSPTLADDVAKVVATIVGDVAGDRVRPVSGIFHCTNNGYTNWYEFSREIFRVFGMDNAVSNPIPASRYPTAAPRPAYSVLSNQKLLETYQQQLPDWRDALIRCRDTVAE